MAGRNDPPSAQHQDMTILVTIGVLIGTVVLLWIYLKPAFVYPAFAIDAVELRIAELFGSDKYMDALSQRVEGHFNGAYDPWDMTAGEMARIADAVGTRVRYGVVLFLLAITALVYMRMRGDNFKRQLNLRSLMVIQKDHWKTLSPSVAFDPDRDDPNMDPPMTPFEWLWNNKINARDGKLDRVACTEAFKRQVGPTWNGVKELALPAQCIAVIAGVHGVLGVEKEKVSLDFRQKISVAWAQSKPSERDGDLKKLLEPWLANKKVVEFIDGTGKKHAFVSSALMEVLRIARREAGVLASAEFLWLKGVDRNLFYALNNVGRRAYLVEGGGSVAHYDAERVAMMALPEPHVDQAVDGVAKYLDEKGVDPEHALGLLGKS